MSDKARAVSRASHPPLMPFLNTIFNNFLIMKFSNLAIKDRHSPQSYSNTRYYFFLSFLVVPFLALSGFLTHMHWRRVLCRSLAFPHGSALYSTAVAKLLSLDVHLCLSSGSRPWSAWPWSAWLMPPMPQPWNSLKKVNWGCHRTYPLCYLSPTNYCTSLSCIWYHKKHCFCLFYLIFLGFFSKEEGKSVSCYSLLLSF